MTHYSAVRLPFTPPLIPDNLFGHLVATAVPGVEEWRDGAFRRTLRLPHGPGIVALRPYADHVRADLFLADPHDKTLAVELGRWLLDLDADPVTIDTALRMDGVMAPLVEGHPGRRVPRSVDAHEFALRAVLGQQVSTAAARTHTARLVTTFGDLVDDPGGGLTHLFPTAEQLSRMQPSALAIPQSRRGTVMRLVTALANGELELRPGVDLEAARAQLLAMPGIGPWTVETIAMRALGDADAFPATDLGVRLAGERLGLPAGQRALTAYAETWRPYRSYAVQHLWATSDHPINRMPL